MNILPNPNDYSRVIITAMKDEAPYMVEWLSFHIAIGFTHFVILTNDCSDGTDKISRHYEKLGIVTHFNNTPPYPKGIQKTGYSRALRLDAIQKAEWLLALDVDEYFRIDIGNGHLDDIFDAIDERVMAISLMWEMYGNNNINTLSDQFITEQFTRSSSRMQSNPYQIRGLKTLYKPQHFERIGTHCPIAYLHNSPTQLLWIDGDGVPMPYLDGRPRWLAYNNAQNFGLTLGRVNHYAIRSLDAYFLKLSRGFVNHTNKGVRSENSASAYWRMFNWNMVENHTISRLKPSHKTMYDVMMSDPKIERLHAQGFAWHQETIAKLRASEDWILEAEEELAEIGQQDNPKEIDLSTFTNPIPQWEFSAQKFKNASVNSILPPHLLEHLKEL